MALALLKFPEAPQAFRNGLVQTLREEQRHTQWYMKRMEECGVRFGDFQVNRFFWDMVSPMETPLDYVTRLSLTFEQANLDYARHYAGIMREAGDTRTAGILEKIYQDEIGHVGYGLKWFREWTRGEGEFEAYEKRLVFPMSPSRAKGNGAPFNEDGRLAAGLDADFIRELRLFERSKGRTPNIYYFNPNAENAIGDPGAEKAELVKDMERDLEIVTAFLSRREDVALVREAPTLEHRERLSMLGFELPEFEELGADGALSEDSLIRERKRNELRPWAWCPESVSVMRDLGETCLESARGVMSKAWEAGVFGEGIVCEDLEAVRKHCVDGRWVVKALFGASGQRNRFWDESNAGWVRKNIAKHGGVVVEPWRERVFDFSAQYQMSSTDGLRLLGFVRMENTEAGQFVAATSGTKFLQGVDSEVARFLMERQGETGRRDVFGNKLRRQLEAALSESGYTDGPVGVDAFVYREADALCLRPVVEVNPRYTMGRVALELRKRVASGRFVRVEIVRKDSGIEEWSETGTDGRLSEGCVILNDRDLARRCLLVLRVTRSVG